MRVLITGATGNVGQACIKLFEPLVTEVVCVARQNEPGIKSIDLSYSFEIEDWLADEGSFDLVIMAHGTQQAMELGDRGFEDVYHEIVNNNLTSAVYLTHHLILNNQLNDNALIVYCSSIQATQPRRGRGPYAIAKAGLEALVKIAAVELAPTARAIGLRLGQLDSTMKGIEFDPAQIEAIEARTLLPWVDCDNVAEFCFDLYGQSQMTGCIIDMDSGHNLRIWP